MKYSINKILSSILIIIPILFLNLGTFKVNRIATGIPVYWIDLWGLSGYLFTIVFIVVVLLFLYFGQARFRLFPSVLFIFLGFLSLLPSLLLVALSNYVPPGIEVNPEVARVSIGIGFFILFLGVVLLLSTHHNRKYYFSILVLSFIFFSLMKSYPQIGLYKELLNLQGVFTDQLLRHLTLALSSAMIAILPGIFLGYASYKHPKGKELIMGFVNVFQVAPTLSLLGLIMIPLTLLSKEFPILAQWGIRGIGFAPAFIVLSLYCLLPIVTNTYAGFEQLNPSILSSAEAMGMTSSQIFRKVSFPLAFPIIISGIRTAITQNIGNTILAGLVGGGGMGSLIFLGLSQSAIDLVLLGTIPVVIMALFTDGLFELFENYYTKRIGVHYD